MGYGTDQLGRLLDELILAIGMQDSAPFANDGRIRSEMVDVIGGLLEGVPSSRELPQSLLSALETELFEADKEPCGKEIFLAQALEGTRWRRLVCRDGKISLQDSKRDKRRAGAYYTPPWVARYLVDRALSGLCYGQKLSVVDPACGSGVFLLALADWMARHLPCDAPGLIVGVEIDQATARVARLLVASRLRSLGLVSRVELCVDAGDALEAASWTRRLSDDGLPQFNAVVGNPPFVSEVRGNADSLSRLKKSPIVGRFYHHKMDLLFYFMGLSLMLVRPGGRIGLVVADYWTNRASAAPLRRLFLEQMQVLEYAQFEQAGVFHSAPGCHPSLLVAEKGASNSTELRLVNLRGAGRSSIEVGATVRLPTGVRFLEREASRIWEIMRRYPSVAEQGVTIAQGVVAPQTRVHLDGGAVRGGRGGVGVFVLNEQERDALDLSAIEAELLRPYYWAHQIEPFSLDSKPGGFLLYLDKEVRRVIEANGDEYSRIRAHLVSFSHRITSSAGPFGLHRPRALSLFEGGSRLLVVRKTRFPRFCVTRRRAYVGEACMVCSHSSSRSSRTSCRPIMR